MAGAIKMHVETTGPFWRHSGQIARATEHAEVRTAEKAEGDIETYLGQVIKQRTGAYEAAVHIERRNSTHVITDGGVPYGPWLEAGRTRGPGGTPRTTRFKGYRAFLRTRNKVAKWLREQTQNSVGQAVKDLN